jgi:arabinofuranosyltransferase
MKTPVAVFTVILIAFFAGSLLHFHRGCYLETNARYHATGSDDAYISFRYAWNFVHVSTLSWNASGYRRTEGFTNPLWVYLAATAALAGDRDAVYPAVAAASVVLTGALMLALLAAAFARDGGWKGVVMPALCAVNPVLWTHATSGLESAVFGMALAVVAYLTLTPRDTRADRFAIASCVVLAVWLRSDGFVYTALLVAVAFLRRSPYRLLLLWTMLFSLAALFFWRWETFHTFPFPNTYIAKVNGGLDERLMSGLRFFVKVMFVKGLWIFPAAALTGLAVRRDARLPAAVVLLGGWMAYYVYIGGDSFLERHLLGVTLVSAALAGPFLDLLLRHRRIWLRTTVVGIAAAAMILPMLSGDQRFRYFKEKPRDPLVLMGKEVSKERVRYGVLVCAPAGKLPYFAGGDCIDPIGLNDPDLARITTRRFQPGHSSGDMQAALDTAAKRGPVSFFTFFPARESDNRNHPVNAPEQILLWIDNEDPGAPVRRAMPAIVWAASRTAFVNWSVIATENRATP